MSVTLSILNSFSLPKGGNYKSGWQGASTAKFTDPFDTSLTNGDAHDFQYTLPTGTTITGYDNDANFPTAPVFLWYKADRITYLQIITGTTGGAGTNVIIGPIPANFPVMIPVASILGAANTTLMTTSAPSVVAIDSVAIGNFSGADANLRLVMIQ